MRVRDRAERWCQSSRRFAGTVNRLVDVPWPLRTDRVDSAWLGLIYRARNARIVAEMLEAWKVCGYETHLWALDDVSPELESFTRGSGPGGKFGLLQWLLTNYPPISGSWIALCDDDVRFRRGTIVDLVALTRSAGLDLAQPAHRRFGNATHHITLVRPRVVARLTHFVEIGPIVVMSPRCASLLLPFPDVKMGWGLESIWSGLSLAGELRLGIVDAITVDHVERPGSHYDMAAARREQDWLHEQSGIGAVETKVNIAWWHRGRRRPDWG